MDTRELNGTYRARAVASDLGRSSKGTEQVAILFELTGEGPEKGTRLTWYGYFSEKTFEGTIKSLRACGWVGTDLTELIDFKSTGLDKSEVDLVIQPEDTVDAAGTVTGRRARVRWVNAVAAIGLKSRLSLDEARSFASRMKAQILQLEQGKPKNNGAPTASSGRPSDPPPHTDDDRPPY